MKPKVAIVILAAGKSSRMGSPKQLLKWGESTVLGHCIEQTTESHADCVYVVLGANSDLIQKEVDCSDVQVILNDNFEAGLGSSIACAAQHLLDPDLAGLLIVLADQPQFEAKHFNVIIDQFIAGKNQIIATDYGTKAGVPALFDRSYFEQLSKLQGDSGAGKLIEEFAEHVIAVAPGFEVLDVDTPEDYHSLATGEGSASIGKARKAD